MRSSMVFLQRGPKTLIKRMTELLAKLTRPRIVKSQPLPIPLMMGAVTREPTQENMFRMKLLRATPSEDFLGMNSVNMVVTILKMSIDPIPKKKFAIIWREVDLISNCGPFPRSCKTVNIPERAKTLPCPHSNRTR